jgi:hypothetical protein
MLSTTGSFANCGRDFSIQAGFRNSRIAEHEDATIALRYFPPEGS